MAPERLSGLAKTRGSKQKLFHNFSLTQKKKNTIKALEDENGVMQEGH